MENYKELKSTEDIEDVFGKRSVITFRCGNCHCAFIQDTSRIRFYESVKGVSTLWNRRKYVVKTECPTCKQELSVVAYSELAINPRDYWKDRLKGK